MPNYALDFLHGGQLRCDACGELLGHPSSPDDGERLPAGQACLVFPELAGEIEAHERDCRNRASGVA